MDNLQAYLAQLNSQLNQLHQQAAAHGEPAPPALRQQIDHHRQAITLIEQTLAGHLSQTDLTTHLSHLNLPPPTPSFPHSPSISGFNLSNTEAGQLNLHDINASVTADGDIIGGSQINIETAYILGASPSPISPPPHPPSRRDFYRRTPLPPHYIPRPELLADLKAALLDTPASLALTSALQIDALHGMGGIGKSVMACSLCDDPEIQAAFPDGILWATLGQHPTEADLLKNLKHWIEALGGIISQTAPTLAQLKENLARQLQQRACLLILDDVWKRSDAEAFYVNAPGCRLLLTTRDAEVARGLGAAIQPIPAMAPAEAIALLEQWAASHLNQAAPELKQRIVKRLGYLPLAIKLAGAQLQTDDPAAWLAEFNALELEGSRIETVHDSLKLTFDLSLRALDKAVYPLYCALVIFKEDEATPAVAIERLWAGLANLTKRQTHRLLRDLAARALLQLDSTDNQTTAVSDISKLSGPTATLHDLLRDFIAAELGEAGRIEAHRALLNTYRGDLSSSSNPKSKIQNLKSLPDDGYLYNHLAYHLNALADHDDSAAAELKDLFADQDWLHARLPQSNYEYDGYIADLMLAWRRAHAQALRQIGSGQPP